MATRGPYTGHLTKPAQVCVCDDGWTCEQHPEQAGRMTTAPGRPTLQPRIATTSPACALTPFTCSPSRSLSSRRFDSLNCGDTYSSKVIDAKSDLMEHQMMKLVERQNPRIVAAALALLVLGTGGCGPTNEQTQTKHDSQEGTKIGSPWSVRFPPLFAYDPRFGPNVLRERWNAPMTDWIRSSTPAFASASDCETGRQELISREYGRRTVSLRLHLDAVARGADPKDIAVLAQRAAEDSGHDRQLENSRCIHDQDARLSARGQVGAGPTYLLGPPTEPDPGEDLRLLGEAPVHLRERLDAPLSRWSQFAAYDSAEACEMDRHALLARVDDNVQRRPKESFTKSAAIVAAARCVGIADSALRDHK
jgi:hypothetical protein